MFTLKEVAWLIIAIIIFEFIIIFPLQKDFSPIIMIVPPLIILFNVIPKKFVGKILSIKVEHKIWEFQRWGLYRRSSLKKPAPIGLFLPFVMSIFSLGLIRMFTLLQFDAKNIHEKRILKQIGFKRKSEINDFDLGFTAAAGFYSLLILALIGFLINFHELTKYTIYYGIWNLIPFGRLDGTKLFYGTVLNWGIIFILNVIALVLIIIY